MPDKGMSGLEKAKYVIFGKSQNASYVWQDREVRFDSPVSALQCRPGETVIDTMVTGHDQFLANTVGLIGFSSAILLCCRARLKTPKAIMASKAS